MELGSIYSGRWLRWLPEGRKPPRGYGQFSDEELIGVGWGFRPRTKPARRCARCRVVEFGY